MFLVRTCVAFNGKTFNDDLVLKRLQSFDNLISAQFLLSWQVVALKGQNWERNVIRMNCVKLFF